MKSVKHALALGLVCLVAHFGSLGAQERVSLRAVEIADTTYIPMDSWVYSALDRLHSMGYLDTAFVGLRPWTRQSIASMLNESRESIAEHGSDSALALYLSVAEELAPESIRPVGGIKMESAYARLRGIKGLTLNDSYHLGQTIANDYGRPYQSGANLSSGISLRAQAGRFGLYYRGEYQYSPSGTGYSPTIVKALSDLDQIPLATNPVQATIPSGSIPRASRPRVLEGYVSYSLLNHEISFGKVDRWFGPAKGGAFYWSTNAPAIYAFQIDRTEPLYVPLLSRVTGPFRYEFHVGSLKGHTAPNAPWIHSQKINFKPTKNLEFGFSRATIWGGKDHAPITIHTFLKSFFSFENVHQSQKFSRDDPGARFGTFDFNYRIPFLRKWLTLYSDSLVHDDMSPLSAPRHAGIRPGLYLSHVPGLPKLDLRVEAVSTDPPTRRSVQGQYLYWEYLQLQGYTNEGKIIGDAIGREGKGGQAWATWHISPMEFVEITWKQVKVAKDFIDRGTTQHSVQISAMKRFHRDLEVSGQLQVEHFKAPFLVATPQTNVVATGQFRWYFHQ